MIARLSRNVWMSAVVLGLGLTNMTAAADLKVGDPAPAFSMKGSDGKTHALSDYKGKQAVVIAWYPKAFTGGCTAECKSFKEKSDDMKKLKVAYFTASVDTPAENKKFAESLSLDYPILSDPEHKASDAYGVTDADNKFPQRRTFYIGKGGKILHIDKKVQTKSHGTDIAAKLAELGVAKKK